MSTWLPSFNSENVRCTWEFDLTVPVNIVVIANGELVEQVLTPSRTSKVCSFRMSAPISTAGIGLTAGPFEAIQDPDNDKLFYFCPPGYLAAMDNSISIMSKAIDSIVDYLSIPFPFQSYKQVCILFFFLFSFLLVGLSPWSNPPPPSRQVFVPVSSTAKFSSGATLAIFSTDILNDASIIDQTFSTRISLVEALAEQWFGNYVLPKSIQDTWLIIGLSRFLAMQYLKKLFGQNEILYRLRLESDWVCEQDVEQPALSDYISEPDETRIEFVRKKVWHP